MLKGATICCFVFSLSGVLGAEKYRIFKLPRDAISNADNKNIIKGEATYFNGLEDKFFISTGIIQNMMNIKGTTTSTVTPVVTGTLIATATATGADSTTGTNTGAGTNTGTGTGTGIGTGTGTGTGTDIGTAGIHETGDTRFASSPYYRNFRSLVKGGKASSCKSPSEQQIIIIRNSSMRYRKPQQQQKPMQHQMPYQHRRIKANSNRKIAAFGIRE